MQIRHRTLALAIAATLPTGAALAQQPAAEEPAQHVTVIGQAASLDKALDKQREADSVQSVVSADAIGQLPDTNVAEALQRVPGVSIERDQGEGRYVRVRGLGPEFNSVTINGSLVPSPDAGSRAVALDVIPSELLETLIINKTLTPDMDANSLGGTIEIQSLTAFDREDGFYAIEAEAGYNDLTSDTSPKLSLTGTKRFANDSFGVAGGLSWEKRDFGSENVETGGAWDAGTLDELEQRDYTITRERLGAVLNFDYRPDDNNQYYLRSLYSEFADDEIRQSKAVEFEDAISEGETADAEVIRSLKDRSETQKILSLVLGGKNRVRDWTFDYAAGYSKSGEDEENAIGGADFAADFAGAGFTGTRKPRPSLPAGANDPANYELDEIELADNTTEDTEYNLRLDIGREFKWAGNPSLFKFGGKLSRRDKMNDENVWIFEDLEDHGFTADQLTMDNFAGRRVDYGLGDFGPGIDPRRVRDVVNGLDRNDFFDEEESRINDYDMSEDINAAYFMLRTDVGRWRLIGGLRYEGTRFEARGTGLEDGDFVAVNRVNTNDHFLPGLHARYALDQRTLLRGAWTNAVVRPTWNQLRPGFIIDTGDAELATGNPDLKPLESSNLDFSIEHYFGRAGVVSAGVFYKDIDNFIYETNLGGSPGYAAWNDYETFENGDSAKVYGLELNYSQQFSRLPAPWNGLLVAANATFTESDAKIRGYDDDSGQFVGRSISLPSQSDLTANLTLGYETESVSLRLSGNYRSKYLLEVGDNIDSSGDIYVDDAFHVDFSANYFVTENMQVYFEALNLTDEPFYAYQGSSAYNAQYEEYGPTYKVGVKLTNF